MIVPMKHLLLLAVAKDGERVLSDLRALGCVHLDLSRGSSEEFHAACEKLAESERAVMVVDRAAREAKKRGASAEAKGLRSAQEILAADERRRQVEEKIRLLERQIREYEPFGNFDPRLAARLAEKGVPVQLVRSKDKPETPAGGYVQRLGEGAWAVVGAPAEIGFGAEEVPIPAELLSTTRARLSEAKDELLDVEASLAASKAEAARLASCEPSMKDQVAFAAAKDSLADAGAVCWIEGWIPANKVPILRARAVTDSWGLALRDPAPGETPPTLIRPPKFFRPVVALFGGLGIAPAYTESDVSVPFMCYFSLFFAMLVGDGGYGAIMLAITLWMWRRTKPEKDDPHHRPAIVRSWLALMTVFSTATVAWGALSNTWFGAAIPACADWPTVKWLGDPSYNNMMFLCFTIGASHLMLARIWNGICKAPDLSCVAEFGWAGIILFMYFTINWIVGISNGLPAFAYWMFGLSLALVFGFTVKPSELKTRGMELGMLPLNIMSALGDVISYVRLFAVGYASLQVAQNFNQMALDLDLPMWAKVVPMVLILLLGHGMNFMLAGLAVLVHAVRLNTLEFSNHKGITWSGQAFCPFRKNQ